MKNLTKLMLVIAIVGTLPRWSQAFNLWQDIQTNTEWTLGQNAAAGTAVALKTSDALGIQAGQYVPSFLAQISQYRFLSAWWGGNYIPQPDGTSKLKDTAKLGFNVAYIFAGFVNQPPQILKNLVAGPSVTLNLISTPHVFVPFFDINYQFGGAASKPAIQTIAPPVTGKLNLTPVMGLADLQANKG